MAVLGQSGGYLAFTNTSNTACERHGWPRLIGLTAAGKPTRAKDLPASSFPDATATGTPTVTLNPHRRADAVLSATDGPITGNSCPPSYRKLRVTPPGDSDSLTISAWIPYLDAFLPACAGIRASPIVSPSTLYNG